MISLLQWGPLRAPAPWSTVKYGWRIALHPEIYLMKSSLITIVALIMVIGAASAQPVNFGIKGGLNLYTVNNKNGDPSYSSKPSFYLGVLGHIHMADQFAI